MRRVVFDFETSGLNPYTGDRPFALCITPLDNILPGMSLNEIKVTLQRDSLYWEWPVDPHTRQVTSPRKNELAQIRAILENPDIQKEGWNVKFDVLMAEFLGEDTAGNGGVYVQGPVVDIRFKVHSVKSDELTTQLKPVAKKYAKISDEDQKSLQAAVIAARRYAKKQGWAIHDEVEADYWLPAAVASSSLEMLAEFPQMSWACREYCTLDNVRAGVLTLMFDEVLDRQPWAKMIYEEEAKLWPVVYEMERHGICTDLDIVQTERTWAAGRAAKLRSQLVEVFGEFNKEISEHVLREYLFNPRSMGGLGLIPDPTRYTEKLHLPQVTADVLESLANVVPILAVKIEHDRCCKAVSTYYDNYISGVAWDESIGCYILHAHFNQIGPVTSRFSCRNPNLQNVPKRGKPGDVMLRVRRPFRPRPGYVWLHMDWKAIEARIFAEEAMEPDMLRIFREGGDIYQELVDRVIALSGIDVISLLSFADSGKPGSGARQINKNNFLGWQYGEGVDKMARAMRLPRDIAVKIIDALKTAFGRAKPFMKAMYEQSKRDHYVTNRYGQRVPVPPPRWKQGEVEEYWYMSVNRLVQSTAARMMKRAMIRCAEYLKDCTDAGLDVKMILTVHDELVFEVKREHLTLGLVRELAKIMKSTAEEHYQHVEFPVDVKVTTESWDQPKDLKRAA